MRLIRAPFRWLPGGGSLCLKKTLEQRNLASGAALLSAMLAVCGPALGQPTGYRGMVAALKSAAATGRVRVVNLGHSVEGRDIPMVAIGPADARSRVMVLCRQHGDEPVSTEAALHVIRRAASGDAKLQNALRGTLLMIVPMVNPDGAEQNRRTNAVHADLNRDWQNQTQPETRAVARAFRQFAPQILLDEHQWTVDDSIHSNSLERALPSTPLSFAVQTEAVKTGGEVGLPLRQTCALPNMDNRLAHRYFGSQGAAAYLLETVPGVDPVSQAALYENLITRLGRLSAHYAPQQTAPLRVSQVARLFSPIQHRKMHKKPDLTWEWLGLAAMAFLLSAWQGFPRRQGEELSLEQRKSGLRRVMLCQVSEASERMERRSRLAHQRKQRKTAKVGVEGRRASRSVLDLSTGLTPVGRVRSTSRLTGATKSLSTALRASRTHGVNRPTRPLRNKPEVSVAGSRTLLPLR